LDNTINYQTSKFIHTQAGDRNKALDTDDGPGALCYNDIV